jgi:peptidoglycan-associated lipoprotein
MKKQILLAATTLTLIMAGCAQKKLNTTDANGVVPGANGANLTTNVDPMGQGNGIYGQDGNGLYGDSGVQNIYFDVNQYNITAGKLGQVSHNANLLRNSGKVKIEGHCDAAGSDEFNYALGLKRAKATKDALMANGISANNVTLVSMGESAPECLMNSSADCYSKNRRVEFKVMQ